MCLKNKIIEVFRKKGKQSKIIVDKTICLCYNTIENEERKKLNKTIKFKIKGEYNEN